MEHNIGVGLIVGAAVGTSLFIYNSDKFNQVQKTILLICIIFPPVQWIGIVIALLYNNYKEQNSEQGIERNKIKREFNNNTIQLNNLKDLRDRGILTQKEYEEKKEKIESVKLESELKFSADYKKLKQLFNDGILTKAEFDSKIQILKNNLRNSTRKHTSESSVFEDNKNDYSNINKNPRPSKKTEYEEPKVIIKKLLIALFIGVYPIPFIAFSESILDDWDNFTWAFPYWLLGATLWLVLLKNRYLNKSILILSSLYTIVMLTDMFLL